jgi:putative transposase
MRRSSFSDAEITEVVRALEAGRPAQELCDTWRISMRTLYRWRRRFGGLKPFAVEALRRLEQENRRLQTELGQSGCQTPGSAGASAGVRSDLGRGERSAAGQGTAVAVGRYAALRLR